ncbi:MAG: metal-sulfur cluster assembly factor, partial [Vulcanimicrobiaceae bacterium]
MSAAREEEVREALGGVIDPELGIDIVNLGLVYGIGIEESDVDIVMTLTVPGCPMHATI